MDEISTKAINIGVAVFITIIIISGVFFVINQIKTIYGQVYETDISIQNSFSEFDQYDNTVKTGIDVINAAKKYVENPLVIVRIGATQINEKSATFYTKYSSYNVKNLTELGNQKYKATMSKDNSTGVMTITFTLIS